jgi:hypothetical protein
MVRERVGDWRLAWRFALAGLLAGLLVVVLSTRGVMGGPFFAAQDQLFPAPKPDQSVSGALLVAYYDHDPFRSLR